ncbi:MAG: hypothetical protein HZB36_01065 [Candidatus Omnitrophica bacterium]|nr:hypothetical protein [Candidatus Omnitrophota bacterium]
MRRRDAKNRLRVVCLLFSFVITALGANPVSAQTLGAPVAYPANLWKGLIAEDSGGDHKTYLHIAWCVRNKLKKEGRTGLVALKRKNLNAFVKREISWAKKMSGGQKDLKAKANKAIHDVFVRNLKDVTNGATHYEHTGMYKTPWWAKKMVVAKVLYPGTKKEITFYRPKRRAI